MLWKGPRRLVDVSIGWVRRDWCSSQTKGQRFSLSKKQSENRSPQLTMEESPVDVIEVTVCEMQKRSRAVRSALQDQTPDLGVSL